MSDPTLLRALADFCVGERSKPLPDQVTHAAVRAIIDWASGTLVGAGELPTTIMSRSVLPIAPTGQSQVVTSEILCDPRTAALINGTASHVAEIDDIYRDGLYHPGAPTIAAVFALAHHLGSSGSDVLRAVTMGYEVGCRIAAAVSPAHYKYWHTTGTVGAIGSAAACAELLRLDAAAFTDALATSITLASGLQQAFRSDSMSKPLHSGRAAESGVLAALSASQGFTGAADILEGDAGFGVAMSSGAPGAELLTGLGTQWCINNITVKNHFCCGHTFAAIDAALELRAQGITAEQIDRITIDTYQAATEVAGIMQPSSLFEAKFSLSYTVAMGLLRGAVRRQAFTEEAMADPMLQRLISITEVRVDPELDAHYPRQRRARVTITDTSGHTHSHQRNTRKGDPDDPLTDDEVDAKFVELVTPILGDGQARAFLGDLRSLPDLDDVRSVRWSIASEGKSS